MATVRDIVTWALRDIGALAASEAATAADADDGLAALNRLVDQWAAERLMIYTVTRTTKALTASDGQYTVGSGGDINIARPIYVDHVNLLDTSASPNTESPLEKLTEDQWAMLAQKALTANQPTSWYYNPTFSSGLATLDLWPVQTGSWSIALYVPTAISEFSSLSTTISLPPGYRRLLVKNLALEVAPSYGRPVDQALMLQASDSKAVIRRANRRPADMKFEAGALAGSRRSYDIITDRFR